MPRGAPGRRHLGRRRRVGYRRELPQPRAFHRRQSSRQVVG